MGKLITLENWELNYNQNEWDEFIKNSINPNLYQYSKFIDIYSYKCEDVKKIVFKKKDKIIATIPIGIKPEKIALSPFSASFGGFNILSDISIFDVIEVTKQLIEYLKKENINSIEIVQPPLFYYSFYDEKIDYSLISCGFEIYSYDVTFYTTLKQGFNNYKDNLIRNTKKAINFNLLFKKIDDIEESFNFIKLQKNKKNYRFDYNINDLKQLYNIYKNKIISFGVYYHEDLIAAIILYRINNKCLLGLNWEQDAQYQLYRPSDFLLYKTLEWANLNRYEYFDFGTITLNGKLNEGLTIFKEKFNPYSALKKRFKLNLQY